MSTTTPSSEDSRYQRQLAYEEAYREWFATLPEKQQQRLRKARMAEPIIERDRRPVGEHDDPVGFFEAAAFCDMASEIDGGFISEGEHAEIEEAFRHGMLWAVQGKSIVQIGQRIAALVWLMKPSLMRGLAFEISRASMRNAAAAAGADRMEDCGRQYGPVLEWLRRGSSLSVLGARTLALAYGMGLGHACEMTLEDIGRPLGTTRQGANKVVLSARDTFNGLRSTAMRGESHRTKCQNSKSPKV